jgi:hypothetical protein
MLAVVELQVSSVSAKGLTPIGNHYFVAVDYLWRCSVVITIADRHGKPHPLGFDQTCDRFADSLLMHHSLPRRAQDSMHMVCKER